MNKLDFASQEWFDALLKRLSDSEEFQLATAHWNEDVTIVVEADKSVGFEKSAGYYVNWKDGKIVEAKPIELPIETKPVYSISAPYSAWANAHGQALDAGIALLAGKFRFSGPFAKAAKNVVGDLLLLETAYEIPTEFKKPIHQD